MVVLLYYTLAHKKIVKMQFKSKTCDSLILKSHDFFQPWIKLSSVIALTVQVVCDGGNGDSKSLAVC